VSTAHRLHCVLIVLLGIWLEQFVLYGPALVGTKILLPLDILAEPGFFIPRTNETANVRPEDSSRTDLVLQFEPERRFAANELAAGRLPVWLPYEYAGVPSRFSMFAPLSLLRFSTSSPIILAWAQLLQASIAGLGAYIFFRRVLGVGFWPAVIPAWCYPISGFFTLWQGFPIGDVICWFPWMLTAVDGTLRRPGAVPVAALAVTTWMALVGGQIDAAALALIASGIFALYQVADQWRVRRIFRAARKALLALTLGWILGFCLAAPYLWPLLEYARTSARMQQRAAGNEDRPPVGLVALPQVILPNIYGTTKNDTLYLAPINQMESAAAAYAGGIAALLIAPLAWSSRRHRSSNGVCALLIILGLGWCLNVPGLVDLLRLPGLNLLSSNRLVFAAAFAILAQSAIGLEILVEGVLPRQRWFAIGALLCAGLCGWCVYRAAVLPEPMATEIEQTIRTGKAVQWVRSIADMHQVQHWFRHSYIVAATVCGIALMGWLYVLSNRSVGPLLIAVIAGLMVGEVLWFGYNRNAQCAPALYYPRIPALDAVVQSPPGRVVGFACLPANLAEMQDLRDIRGYDPFDPDRLVQLVSLAADQRFPTPHYAVLQTFTPAVYPNAGDGGIHVSPILDMLGVRYTIFRGAPPSGVDPDFRSADYWVLVNRSALPHVFVPEHVEVEPDAAQRLKKLAAADFDPRAIAYVETDVALPAVSHGEVTIRSEIPTKIVVALKMETAGLVVLSDLWHRGWQAYVDGRPVPILRANHAVRGVIVPAGATSLEFRYAPASFTWGMILCGTAAAGLLLWIILAAASPPPACPDRIVYE